ncbi:MAG: prepilin-type N-terminal cleavage/methylation domain-containing protein [Magnetococcus sp. MYC-9]
MNRAQSMQGFTFLEVLVAIVCIGLVVSGLGAATVAALQQPTLSRETLQATYIAQEMMERVMARKIKRLDLSTYPTETACFQPSVTLAGATFTCTLSVVASPFPTGYPACPASSACQLVTIRVTSPAGAVVLASWMLVI